MRLRRVLVGLGLCCLAWLGSRSVFERNGDETHAADSKARVAASLRVPVPTPTAAPSVAAREALRERAAAVGSTGQADVARDVGDLPKEKNSAESESPGVNAQPMRIALPQPVTDPAILQRLGLGTTTVVLRDPDGTRDGELIKLQNESESVE